jgi:hypothetical protein
MYIYIYMNRSVRLHKVSYFYTYNAHVQYTEIASITELQSSEESNARYVFFINNAFTFVMWTTKIIYTDGSVINYIKYKNLRCSYVHVSKCVKIASARNNSRARK